MCDDDTDTDDAGEPNPYSSYDGWESWDYGHPYYGGGTTSGDYNFQLVWFTSGSAVATLCDGCEFVFDVVGAYDAGVSVDDGLAAKYGLDTDFEWTYAYTDDYYGYGGAWLFEYYGTYYWNGYADFDGSTFSYTYGNKDYYYDGAYGYYPDYAGYYMTNYMYGTAAVQ